MTRRDARIAAFQVLFSTIINEVSANEALLLAKEVEEPILDDFAEKIVLATYNHLYEIDNLLVPHLKGWSIKRISKMSLTILRLSIAQLYYWDEIDDRPIEGLHRIVINESVAISKLFGNDDDYIFVNGVLGSIVRSTKEEEVS